MPWIVGETKWSFWKLLIHAIESIVAFVVIRYLLFGDPVQGWGSFICVLLFLGGIQRLYIGILGQYLVKTYLEADY